MTAKVKESSNHSKGRGSKHYKMALDDQVKGGEVRIPKEKGPKDVNIKMLKSKTNKGIGGCVWTPCPDIFCKANEGSIILN